MFHTQLKLAGAVRPYYGGTRLEDEEDRENADRETTDETTATTAPDAPKTASQPAGQKPSADSRVRSPQSAIPGDALIAGYSPSASHAAIRNSSPPEPKAILRSAAQADGWNVLELGDDLQIDVPTEGGRRQVVAANFDRRDREGRRLIALSSLCGPFNDRNAAPLLRYNAKLPYGAFAVERTADQEESVVLRATYPADIADPQSLRRIIAEIAHRADKVEDKLTGTDQF